MRTMILNGKIDLPAHDKFEDVFGKDLTAKVRSMFKAMWLNFLANEEGVSGPYWLEKFGPDNVVQFNQIIRLLDKNGWVISTTSTNAKFSKIKLNKNKLLEFVSPEELIEVRAKHKFDLYLPILEEDDCDDEAVRMNGKTVTTGLVRTGMNMASHSPFYYDSSLVNEEMKKAIIRNVNKGMSKIRAKFPQMKYSKADYDAVSTEIVELLLKEPMYFNMGKNYIDSRGRAIKAGLSKVANPIGYKDFRAMMVIPEQFRNKATPQGAEAIYLFIAELNGYKGGTVADKLATGKHQYQNRITPSFEDSTVFEIIWLLRLYRELDQYHLVQEANALAESMGLPGNEAHYWSTPIELDASASMLQYIGLLMDDARLLTMTNVLDMGDGALYDPWKFEGIPRTQFKHAATPRIYGSSKTPSELWRKKKHSFTMEQVQAFNKELRSGGLAIADGLKHFIIKWVRPAEKMNLEIWKERFTVECNRYKRIMDQVIAYQIWDSASETYPIIHNVKQVLVPDLDAFKRWFVTGLIHNLDSQVCNEVIGKTIEKYHWGLDIHDAFIVCPEAAKDAREWYAEQLIAIHNERHEILTRYFDSIGIDATAALEWQQLMDKVVHPKNGFKANRMALK